MTRPRVAGMCCLRDKGSTSEGDGEGEKEGKDHLRWASIRLPRVPEI